MIAAGNQTETLTAPPDPPSRRLPSWLKTLIRVVVTKATRLAVRELWPLFVDWVRELEKALGLWKRRRGPAAESS